MIYPWKNLGDLIDRERDPNALALIDLLHADEPRHYTYAELDRIIGNVAALLTRKGFRRGTPIGIAALNRMEYIASYFGAMRAGMVAVPLFALFGVDAIEHRLGDSGAVALITDRGGVQKVERGMSM